MVFSSEKSGLRIDHLVYFGALNNRQKEQLQEEEGNKELMFVIPPHLTSNGEKTIYKVGFTAEFLKLLYPDKKFNEICQILNDRYEIFLSRRQIERYVKKFKENKKYQ